MFALGSIVSPGTALPLRWVPNATTRKAIAELEAGKGNRHRLLGITSKRQ
jgi:hypothetical protein